MKKIHRGSLLVGLLVGLPFFFSDRLADIIINIFSGINLTIWTYGIFAFSITLPIFLLVVFLLKKKQIIDSILSPLYGYTIGFITVYLLYGILALIALSNWRLF